MAVRPALTSTEISRLAKAGVVRPYLWIDNSDITPLATARVNGDPTFPVASLPVMDTSVGWSDVTEDKTVFIGSTEGAFDRGIYRTRQGSTDEFLEIEQFGQNDGGAINIAVRTETVQDGDYITVLERFDPFGVIPTIVYEGVGNEATIYEDYNLSYTNFNRYPPCQVNIFVDGQPSNLGVHLYTATSYTFDISMAITKWATSSSATYEIVLPAGITLNSGSLTGSSLTPTINVTAQHNPIVYTVKFVVTENNGSVWTSYRKLGIFSNTYPPLEVWRVDDDGGDTTGWHMQLTLRGLTSASPAAMYHYFEMATWGGAAVPTASTCFTGWCMSRREVSEGGVPSVSLDLVGPAGIMEALGASSQIFSSSTDPQNWQEVYISLSYLDFMIWWVLARRVSGILQLFNFTSFGLDFTELQMPEWRMDTGTVLSQVQSLAKRWLGGNFGVDPTGEIMLRRRPSLVPYDDRGDIDIRATIDQYIYKSATLGYQARPQVRRLRGEAFYSNGSDITPVWCDAPTVPGQGSREDKEDRLIVNNADELYADTGNEYQYRNNPYPSGTIAIPKNYAVIYPAQFTRLILSIPDYLRYDHEAWENYVTALAVQRIHNVDGTIDTQIPIEQETAGVPGVDVPIPVPDESVYNSRYAFVPFAPVPIWRSTNPNPAGSGSGARVVPKDGSIAFGGTANKAYYINNLTGTPRYVDITPTLPTGYTIRAGTLRPNSLSGYLLLSDGTNSKVAFCANISATTRSWSIGTAYTGVYTIIRTTGTAGQVFIETSSAPGGGVTTDTVGGNWRTTFDFTVGDGGFVPSFASPNISAVYIPGVGWAATTYGNNTFGWYRVMMVLRPITPTFSLSSISFDATFTPGTYSTPHLLWEQNGFPFFDQAMTTSGTFTKTWTGPYGVISQTPLDDYMLIGGFATQSAAIAAWDITLTKLVLIGVGLTNPFTASGGSNVDVRYSSNNGSTFGSALTVGSFADGATGFDVQLSGGNSFAAYSGKIKRATTLGGAYSDYYTVTGGAQATCIVVPWYTYSGSLNNGTNPDILVGLSAADGSSRTMLWIEGGATPGTVHDITPASGRVFSSPNSITTFKNINIAAVPLSSGTPHLYTSNNTGTSFVDRGASGTANWLRVRRNAGSPGQLIIAGSSVAKYSADFGATLVNKALSPDPNLLFIEFYA